MKTFALRAVINLLPDSIETGRMPSGLSLTLEVSWLYDRRFVSSESGDL
jgi:hypothetical protein